MMTHYSNDQQNPGNTGAGSEAEGRVFSAKARAKAEGQDNEVELRAAAAAQAADDDLRTGLEEKHGRPFIFAERNGEERLVKVNDVYHADLFKASGDILYEPDEVTFYKYLEPRGLWQRHSEESNLVDLSKFYLHESQREGGEPKLEAKRSLALVRSTQTYLKGVGECRGAFSREASERNHIVHLANGVVIVRDNKYEGFSPVFRRDYYSRNQCPVAFDPAAECPRFLNELLYPGLPEETRVADAELLQRFFGLFLLGVNLAQKILIMQGGGGSGKSTLANIAQQLVGEENYMALRTEHLASRFELFSYIGRTLLVGADVDPRFLLKRGAEVLKSLTGGDSAIYAEGKHNSQMVRLKGGAMNVLVVSNSGLVVKIEGDRGAWDRRLVVINFEAPSGKRREIPEFGSLLLGEEGPGILNWALAGLQRVLADTEAGKGFPLTQAQRDRTEAMLANSEGVERFLRDRVESAPGCALLSKELIDGCQDFCTDEGIDCPAVREIQRRLPELMKRLFNTSLSRSLGESKGSRGYRNVGWRDEDDAETL